MIKPILLVVVLALAGCASPKSDISTDSMLQTIVPVCSGTHIVAVDSSHAVAQVRSECQPAAKPQ
jgi:hypothetical protein